ncbi:unnamed protein product [Ilex paraguariensis]|uniref:BHLH domain-containing protein n=1 Tax=Ilex paraguariensis TaxID=185542 RepID=A0ABC8TEU5_9AQUA
MDQFFQYDTFEDMLWLDDALPVNQSAFVCYRDQPIDGFQAKGKGNGSDHRNINKRITEFLRRNRKPMNESKGVEIQRGYKHMISERMRRERQKQSYLALLSMLPPGTKGDKNSIIQVAAENIQELQRYKEELERKNTEIEGVFGEEEMSKAVEKAKIKFRVPYPSSGINSMLEVLKCLKATGSKTRGIQSEFSPQEFSAVLDIETKILLLRDHAGQPNQNGGLRPKM